MRVRISPPPPSYILKSVSESLRVRVSQGAPNLAYKGVAMEKSEIRSNPIAEYGDVPLDKDHISSLSKLIFDKSWIKVANLEFKSVKFDIIKFKEGNPLDLDYMVGGLILIDIL